jgi:hypothetical protein
MHERVGYVKPHASTFFSFKYHLIYTLTRGFNIGYRATSDIAVELEGVCTLLEVVQGSLGQLRSHRSSRTQKQLFILLFENLIFSSFRFAYVIQLTLHAPAQPQNQLTAQRIRRILYVIQLSPIVSSRALEYICKNRDMRCCALLGCT